MKHILFVITILSVGVPSLFAQGKKDYIHMPGPVKFENALYYLSDSYHPEAYYYKQEYIPKGETADKFNSMITIDVLIADVSVKDVVTQKVSELEEMKKTNPVVNYKVYEQTDKGEYMLDFLISQNADGNVQIVEWNLYPVQGIYRKR